MANTLDGCLFHLVFSRTCVCSESEAKANISQFGEIQVVNISSLTETAILLYTTDCTDM